MGTWGSPGPLRRRLPSAATENGSQLVGLRVKFGRSRSTRIERRRSGMPSRIWGRGSETAVIWAVSGFDVERRPDDDVAEVIGTRDRRVITTEAERRALVGAGEVDLAGNVEGVVAGAGAGNAVPICEADGTARVELAPPGRSSRTADAAASAASEQ